MLQFFRWNDYCMSKPHGNCATIFILKFRMLKKILFSDIMVLAKCLYNIFSNFICNLFYCFIKKEGLGHYLYNYNLRSSTYLYKSFSCLSYAIIFDTFIQISLFTISIFLRSYLYKYIPKLN